MSVSVEVLRQVRSDLIAGDYVTVGVDALIRQHELADNPDKGLAEALRNAYYNDGRTRSLAGSRNPDQWLRMAAAAREFVAGEAEVARTVPRVFNKGDRIPEDVKAVRCGDGSGAVRTMDGGWEYADLTSPENVAEVGSYASGWSYFFTSEYPLTEVLEIPVPVDEDEDDEPETPTYSFKPGDRVRIVGPHQTAEGLMQFVCGDYGIVQEPEMDVHLGSVHILDMDGEGAHCWLDPASLEPVPASPEPATVEDGAPGVFHKGDEIPDDVIVVRTDEGKTAVRTALAGHWLYLQPLVSGYATVERIRANEDGWDFFYPREYPLTDVTPEYLEVTTEVAPSVIRQGETIPAEVVQVRAATGNVAVRTASGEWLYMKPDYTFEELREADYGWDYFTPSEYPLTVEKYDPATAIDPDEEPRTWESLADVPHDVEAIDNVGDHWRFINGRWNYNFRGDQSMHAVAWDDPTEYDNYAPFTEVKA